MKTIEYAADGEAIADAECEGKAYQFLQDKDRHDCKVANSTFCTAIRALVHEGFIDHAQVRFLYKGEFINVTSDGRLEHWPMGFCDVEELLIDRILTS